MAERLEIKGGGTLFVGQEGPRAWLLAERPADGRGLYKVWLTGARGGRFLLGTLAPEGNSLRLKRNLPVGELERVSCWPVAGAECVLSFPFSEGERWYREAHPERLLRDPELRRQVRGGMLCRRERDGFRLAAPFRGDGPMPLEGLFCLAQVKQLEGRPHLVWSFDREGRPRLLHKEEKSGDNNLQ